MVQNPENANGNFVYHLPFENLKYLETLILSNFALTPGSLYSMLQCTRLVSINMEKMKNIPADFLESLLRTKQNTLRALHIYEEGLDVDFYRRAGVGELEGSEDAGVEHPNFAYHSVSQDDLGAPPGEICRRPPRLPHIVCCASNTGCKSDSNVLCARCTFSLPQPVAAWGACGPQQQHGAVQQPVHQLEAGGAPAVHRAQPTLVTRSRLCETPYITFYRSDTLLSEGDFRPAFCLCVVFVVYVHACTRAGNFMVTVTFDSPAALSCSTTSLISNSLSGSGIFLLAASVFSSPGSSRVRATWNSRVLGLAMSTALSEDRGAPSFVDMSSREHWKPGVRALPPQLLRELTERRLRTRRRHAPRTTFDVVVPAIAMSSYRSQAWMTSWRVGGTRTRSAPSPASSDVTRHMRDSSAATLSPLSLRTSIQVKQFSLVEVDPFLAVLQLRIQLVGAVGRKHLALLDRILLAAVLGGRLDEDILGVKRDLGMVAVDDGRHGEDHPVFVLDDRVHRAVPDYAQDSLVKLIPLRTAATAYGRTCAVLGVRCSDQQSSYFFKRYWGGSFLESSITEHVVYPFIVMPVDADLNCTDVVSPGCELKGLRTWKDICLVRNSLFQHQLVMPWIYEAAAGACARRGGQRPGPGLIRGRSTILRRRGFVCDRRRHGHSSLP
ncbi:hypothetical protein MSG28_008175 [Choristoneura fumiferana]|uniref:Uncharacterized protein n=1 Tax=Choristoneura fumiferana TaxID=7141 RepID=A0ACC0JA85_CHOFU|nr:hypothetical protein MSG28_008175 [Choristoneura fumiferana]